MHYRNLIFFICIASLETYSYGKKNCCKLSNFIKININILLLFITVYNNAFYYNLKPSNVTEKQIMHITFKVKRKKKLLISSVKLS